MAMERIVPTALIMRLNFDALAFVSIDPINFIYHTIFA